MPKQSYTIKDWSGGINNRKDPRDIFENEFSHISNMSIDSLGKVKTVGVYMKLMQTLMETQAQVLCKIT